LPKPENANCLPAIIGEQKQFITLSDTLSTRTESFPLATLPLERKMG
jgi:hypothetical protein